MIDATMEYVLDESKVEADDSDDDQREFDDASVEEAEDRLLNEYHKKQGKPLSDEEIKQIIRNKESAQFASKVMK